MSSEAQTYLDKGKFGWSEGGMGITEVIQSERQLNFEEKRVFLSCYINFQMNN